MKLITTLLVLMSALTHADTAEESPIKAILVVGKMSGACGIFRQQVIFQESTKMDKGDDFIQRFWTTEAARLGHTLAEYAQQCHETMKVYREYESFDDSAGKN